MAPPDAPPGDFRTLVIGMGHDCRHDDAVGLIAARQLRARKLQRVEIVEASGEGTALMELWQNAGTVILLDAVRSGAAPGTIHRLDARNQTVPTSFLRCSTHAFGAAEAIELARALNRLPPRLLVFGIEGRDFTQGAGLSPEVRKALPAVLEAVTRQTASVAADG